MTDGLQANACQLRPTAVPVTDQELLSALGYSRYTGVVVKARRPLEYGLVFDYHRDGNVTVRMECDRFRGEDVSYCSQQLC
jgi:hypothetical protein